MEPRISIVTVSYNAASTIGDTLTSVAAQREADFEHIIVDGASRDATMEIVRQCAHDRLFAVSEADAGIYDAMNKGIARARGEFLLFLNSDDYLARPDSLSLALNALERTGVDCLFADTQFVGPDGRTPSRRLYSARQFSRWWLRVGAMPPHPSMFLRRSLVERLGGYDTTFRIAGDFDLVARALLGVKASYAKLPSTLTNFRTGGMSTSGIEAKMALNREFARSLRQLEQPFSSLLVLLRLPLKLAQFRLRQSTPSGTRDWPPDYLAISNRYA